MHLGELGYAGQMLARTALEVVAAYNDDYRIKNGRYMENHHASTVFI